jgi:hypothetical protein
MVAREDAVQRDGFSNPNIPKIATGRRGNLIEYFGEASVNIGPDVTDVHMTNRSIGAHSHEVDEFQILLGKPGAKFQGRDVPPLLLHYSDAFAIYGPLEGGEIPFHLIQLRTKPIDNAKGGAWGDFRLPDDRDLMPYVSERHEEAVVPETSEHESLDHGDLKSETIIGPAADGLGSVLITAGHGTVFTLPSPKDTSGQFVYVANGTVELGDRSYGEGTIGWQEREEAEADLTAGESGCRVVLMRFPYPASTAARAMTSPEVAKRLERFA